MTVHLFFAAVSVLFAIVAVTSAVVSYHYDNVAKDYRRLGEKIRKGELDLNDKKQMKLINKM